MLAADEAVGGAEVDADDHGADAEPVAGPDADQRVPRWAPAGLDNVMRL
jgi:hypothetical protein